MNTFDKLYSKALEIEKENKLIAKYGEDYPLGQLFEDIKEQALKEDYDGWFLIDQNTELNDFFIEE